MSALTGPARTAISGPTRRLQHLTSTLGDDRAIVPICMAKAIAIIGGYK